MRRLIGIVLTVIAFAGAGRFVAAEEKKIQAPVGGEVEPAAAPSAFSGPLWADIKLRLTHLKEALMSSSVERHYQARSAFAVAAVRGAQQKLDDPNKPYWKGTADSKKKRTIEEERAEFGAAVDLLLAGKTEEGLKKLDEFEAKHPKSSLLKDVRDTREMIQKAAAASVAATPGAAGSGGAAAQPLGAAAQPLGAAAQPMGAAKAGPGADKR